MSRRIPRNPIPRDPERLLDLDIPLPEFAPPFMRRLVAAAARMAQTTSAVLTGPARDGYLLKPRHCAIWIAYHATTKGLTEIGRGIGRDHSTVFWSVRKVESLLVTEREETIALIRGIVARTNNPKAALPPEVAEWMPPPPKRKPKPKYRPVEGVARYTVRGQGFDGDATTRLWFAENDAAFRAAFAAAHPELAEAGRAAQ